MVWLGRNVESGAELDEGASGVVNSRMRGVKSVDSEHVEQ
jgi:hypothetical protein